MAGREVKRICYPFPGATLGGSHITILTLVGVLDRSRFEPMVVLHETGRLSRHLDKLGTPYQLLPLNLPAQRKPGLANLAALLRITPGLAGFLRREKISLVHSSQSLIAQNWALSARLAGCKHLWDQRGRVLDSRLERLLRRTAQGLMVNSNHVSRQLPPSLERRCRVIYPPVAANREPLDRARARAEILAEAGLRGDPRLVGFFANLVERKRPRVFLAAAELIAREMPGQCAFVMFGDDREGVAAELAARARAAGLEQSFRYLGFRGPGQYWLSGCDLLLAPSVGEPFGRVLVEAMLAGTPVVAADSGGHREIMEHGVTGRLARPDDPEALAREALVILNDPESTGRMTAAAGREARQRFGLDRFRDEVQNLYDELIFGQGKA